MSCGNPGPAESRSKATRAALILSALLLWPSHLFALPKRLILCLDGVAYRDMQALQAGVNYTNVWGFDRHYQAFNHGYFPVSRLVSTFPSSSDVAWTDIFGNRPLAGYQRTYYSSAANSMVSINGITTTVEHESQMHWEMENGLLRTMGYVYPVHVYRYELDRLFKDFFEDKSADANFYAYVRTTDDAQHLARDIFAMLSRLDGRLQALRAQYKAREGRELEILVLSDHGNNHAGPGKRVGVKPCLKAAGYRIANSIRTPKDVVLPIAGIENWVEIHNAPVETENLLRLLARLPGADILTALAPGLTNSCLVLNSRGDRALIEWKPGLQAFRYSVVTGDPLGCLPAHQLLAAGHKLDADGFAGADDWMAATMTNKYPAALERIVRGLTQVTLNPATILISLDNAYVHANWLVKQGSELTSFGGTHGGLDDLSSVGMLMSSFGPTPDTLTSRVAGLFAGFPGMRPHRELEDGAEWIAAGEQSRVRTARDPLDQESFQLPSDGIALRIWSPKFVQDAPEDAVEIIVRPVRHLFSASGGGAFPAKDAERRITLAAPCALPRESNYERVYPFPPELKLQPLREYSISGDLKAGGSAVRLFQFSFHADARGLPAPF